MTYPHSEPFIRRTARLLVSTLLALGLAACGGSSSDSTATGTGTGTGTAPSIATQPASRSVAVGESASFSVAAGGGTPTYQWFKDGSAISGATSSTYAIASVVVADAGAYHVVVANSAGSVTSGTATLTVTSLTSADGSWNIVTGAHAADSLASFDFELAVAIDLDTLAITTSSPRLLPGTAAAGITPITLDGTEVITVATDRYGLTIESNPPSGTHVGFALSGTYSGSITFLSDRELEIALDGVAIASPDGPAINVQSGRRTFVVVRDGTTNTLSDSSTWSTRYLDDGSEMDLKATLFSEGPLIFSGTGILDVTASTEHAVASDDHVRIVEGNLALTARERDGIRANDAFIMDGGNVSIETDANAGKGIKVDGKEDDTAPLGFIAINAGLLTIHSFDKAITASWETAEDAETATLADDPDPRVTINGGTLAISTFGTPFETATDSLSPEGIESKTVLTINGGDLTIETTDDALNAGTAIVVNGGRIYARATRNDAVDSNGTLTIRGGLLVANGASGAEGGLDCDQNTFTVTGGTFIGIGGRNSSPTRAVTTQNTVSLRNGAANALLVVKDGSGNVAFAYTLPATSSSILLSSPDIRTGTAYTVATGGSLGASTESFHGLHLGAAGHSGGTTVTTFTPSSTVTAL